MEADEIFTGSKWAILKELAKGRKSASEVARKTGQSTANTTVQLKLLEAHGYVKKSRQDTEARRKTGKPKTPYELSQEVALTGALRPGLAYKKTSRMRDLGDFQKYLLNTACLADEDVQYALVKYALDSNMIKKADLICLVSQEGRETELFIVTESHLEEVRSKHSNASVEVPGGKTKKVISWSHNKKEVEEGLERGDSYFQNMVRNSSELLDKKGLLSEWKK